MKTPTLPLTAALIAVLTLIADGKGGHQRIIPVSKRFFTTLADYLESERPTTPDTRHVFVVLKGPRRGQPLSEAGLDEIISGARQRAGIQHLTCHQLRPDSRAQLIASPAHPLDALPLDECGKHAMNGGRGQAGAVADAGDGAEGVWR